MFDSRARLSEHQDEPGAHTKRHKADSKFAADDPQAAEGDGGGLLAASVAATARAAPLHFRALRNLSVASRVEELEDASYRSFAHHWLKSHGVNKAQDDATCTKLESAIQDRLPDSCLQSPAFVDVLCAQIVTLARGHLQLIACMSAVLGARLNQRGPSEPGEVAHDVPGAVAHVVDAIGEVRLAPLRGSSRESDREKLYKPDAEGAAHAAAMLDGLFFGLGELDMEPATRRAIIRQVFKTRALQLSAPLAGHLIALLGGSGMRADIRREVVDAIVAVPPGKDSRLLLEEELGRGIVFGLGHARTPPQALAPILDALVQARARSSQLIGIVCGMIGGLGGSGISPAHRDALVAWVKTRASKLDVNDFQDLVQRLAHALATIDDRLGKLKKDQVRIVIDLFFCIDHEGLNPRFFAFELNAIARSEHIRKHIDKNPLLSDEQREAMEVALEDNENDNDGDG